MQSVAKSIAARAERKRNGARAAQMKAYLKSDLEHWGLGMPELRSLARSIERSSSSATLGLVDELWSTGVFELRMLAALTLIAAAATLEVSGIDAFERLLSESKTWALVDPLSIDGVGRMFERFPQLGRRLDRWARDDNFWMRRAAMLTLLKPLRRGGGDFDRFSRYADAMLAEKEFFIRKAIGWTLRDVSKKRPEMVRDWVRPRAHLMSGVTIREAVKRLAPREREALMNRYRRGVAKGPAAPSTSSSPKRSSKRR